MVNISERIIGSSADLQGEIQWQNYVDKNYFTYYCDLMPNRQDEKIIIDVIGDKILHTTEGIVYVLVIDGKILTFGHSIRTFKARLGSYNAGKKKQRKGKATNSVTNYYILQSILNIGLPVQVYLMTPEHSEWKALGETGTEPFPSVKMLKKTILAKFEKQYGKSPIGNTQK